MIIIEENKYSVSNIKKELYTNLNESKTAEYFKPEDYGDEPNRKKEKIKEPEKEKNTQREEKPYGNPEWEEIFQKIRTYNKNAKRSNYNSLAQLNKVLNSHYRNIPNMVSKTLNKKSQVGIEDANKIKQAKDDINKFAGTKFETKSQRLDEVSRNELLAKAKLQTLTRYEKSSGYKGFSVIDIDTTSVLTKNNLRVTCRVGKYYDTIELDNILYWIQLEAEKNENFQVNTKGITAAIMNAADGMDIKVDCTCGDFKYRFAYMATKLGYKFGKSENRKAKITNPDSLGSMCKHLISMLSNKKWMSQVTGTLMDFIEERINEVNIFLKVKEGEELTLPNELARRNAKAGFYSKLFKDKEEEPEEEEELIDVDTEEEVEEIPEETEEELIDVDKEDIEEKEDNNNE